MSTRTLAVLAVVLVAAPAAYADFSAEMVLTGPAVVDPGDPVIVTVTLQNLTLEPDPGPGNDISRIALNFSNSDPDLTGATWAWDAYVTGLGLNVDDTAMNPDEFVQVSKIGTGVVPGVTTFDLGTLTFTAPPEGLYTLNLSAGTTPSDVTVVADGEDYMMDQSIYMSGYPLTLGVLDLEVTPEPATLALLGMGGAALLLRRRR